MLPDAVIPPFFLKFIVYLFYEHSKLHHLFKKPLYKHNQLGSLKTCIRTLHYLTSPLCLFNHRSQRKLLTFTTLCFFTLVPSWRSYPRGQTLATALTSYATSAAATTTAPWGESVLTLLECACHVNVQ